MRGPIVHLVYESKEAVCGAMVRIQEFYESPLPHIRNCVFSFSEYAAANAAANGGKYLYDWDGYNVPGHVVQDFFARFDTLSADEAAIKTIISGVCPPDFYLIATHMGDAGADDTNDVIEHEICHARWYLDPRYGAAATNLVCDFAEQWPDTYAGLTAWLRKRGYDESVFSDEIHAYLATTPEEWWIDPEQGLSERLAHHVWLAGLPLRELIALPSFPRPHIHTVPFTTSLRKP